MRQYLLFFALIIGGFAHSVYAQDQKLSYFNPSLPDSSFFIPLETNVEIASALGERMTLPSATGFVDSVSVVFDTMINGDSIEVALIEDTLLPQGIGTFHVIDQWNDSELSLWNDMIPARAVYWSIGIPSASVKLGVPTLVKVPHVPVPQNFFVVVVPRISSVSNCSFSVQGDTEAHVVRTAENTRACLMSYNQALQQYDMQPLDSASDFGHAFYYGGMYSDLNIAAYVQPGSNASIQAAASIPQCSVYPNPASSVLRIQDAPAQATMELIDLLGNRVRSLSLDGTTSLDISALPVGMYEAVLHSEGKWMTQPVMIVH